MKTKIILTFFIIFFHALSQSAIAQDYCNSEGKTLTAYFAPRLDAVNQEVKNYQSGIEAVFLKLQVGDKLEVLIAHDAGVAKSFSACFPGCPPQGILNQFIGLGGSCKATLADRDKINFKRTFVSSVKRTLEDAQDGNLGYKNILKTLGAIKAHEKSTPTTNQNTYLVSSMFNKPDIDRDEADSFFVSVVQDKDMLDKFPELQVLGIPLNPDLISVWTDLYAVNGQNFDYR